MTSTEALCLMLSLFGAVGCSIHGHDLTGTGGNGGTGGNPTGGRGGQAGSSDQPDGAADGGASGGSGGGDAAAGAGGGAAGTDSGAGTGGGAGGTDGGVDGAAGTGGTSSIPDGGAGTGGAVSPCNSVIGWGDSPSALLAPKGDVVALYATGRPPELHHWTDDATLPLAENHDGASAAAFSSDGTLFAASTPVELDVWRVSDGTLVHQIPALANARTLSLSNAGDVIAAVLGPPGSHLVDVGVVWRSVDAANVRTVSPVDHPGVGPMHFARLEIADFAVSPDASRVAMKYTDLDSLSQPFGFTDEWKASDGSLVWSDFLGATVYGEGRLSFSPDGTHLVGDGTLAQGGTVILDASTGTQVGSVISNLFLVSSISDDGKVLVGYGSDQKHPMLYDTSTGLSVQPILHAGEVVVGVGVGASPSHKSRVVTKAVQNHAFLYYEDDASVGQHAAKSFDVGGPVISADGQLVAGIEAGITDAWPNLWNPASDAVVQTWPTTSARGVALSPDASMLYGTSGGTFFALMLNGQTGGYTIDAAGTDRVGTPVVSPSGALVALPGPTSAAQLRRASDGMLVTTLRGHTDAVEVAAFSADGKKVATGSDDATVRIWDVSAGTAVGSPLAMSAAVLAVAFTPDGTGLVSGDIHGNLQLWDLSAGTVKTMTNTGTDIFGVAISPDGATVYVAQNGNGSTTPATPSRVARYHLPDWAPLSPVRLYSSTSFSVAISLSKDGSRLASAGDGVIRVDCLP
ncbi:MAG TPA: WD40 repeat domain-containing protein [Polyangia bacterium]|nr:WD40 repeat domain-containing protein [Polyangia bacterium]